MTIYKTIFRLVLAVAVTLLVNKLVVIQNKQGFTQPPFRRKPFASKCQRHFNKTSNRLSRIFLAINFNHPHYGNIPTLTSYFKPVFPDHLICGPRSYVNGDYVVLKIDQVVPEYGFYGYQCLVEAIKRNPGRDGYLLINDDMIINWWNFLHLDKTKIWFGDQMPNVDDEYLFGSIPNKWYSENNRGIKCERLYKKMSMDISLNSTGIFTTFRNNTSNKEACIGALSDIFYIPKQHADLFARIGQRFYDDRSFLEVAVPMALYLLERKSNIIHLKGVYLQRKYGWGSKWKYDTEKAWKEYNYSIAFLHPYKLSGVEKARKVLEFEENVARISKRIFTTQCLDDVTKDDISLVQYDSNHTVKA